MSASLMTGKNVVDLSEVRYYIKANVHVVTVFR
jgi:hypothetical protein